MSVKELLLNAFKPWLNIRVNSLTSDELLTTADLDLTATNNQISFKDGSNTTNLNVTTTTNSTINVNNVKNDSYIFPLRAVSSMVGTMPLDSSYFGQTVLVSTANVTANFTLPPISTSPGVEITIVLGTEGAVGNPTFVPSGSDVLLFGTVLTLDAITTSKVFNSSASCRFVNGSAKKGDYLIFKATPTGWWVRGVFSLAAGIVIT